jgi:hypothetical protein
MRLPALLVTLILMATTASAQEGGTAAAPAAGPTATSTSSAAAPASSAQESASSSQDDAPSFQLPVSLDRIRSGLERPAPRHPLLGLHDQPHFVVEVQQRNPLLELLATLNVKTGPVPAGGIEAAEQQRLMFPPVDNPLRQPYAAFNQPELLTVLIENLAGKYLGGRALSAVTAADRASAEALARQKVREAVGQYCATQPNHGAGIQLCTDFNQ